MDDPSKDGKAVDRNVYQNRRKEDGLPYWTVAVKSRGLKYKEHFPTLEQAVADRDRVEALVARGMTVFGFPQGNTTQHKPKNSVRWLKLGENGQTAEPLAPASAVTPVAQVPTPLATSPIPAVPDMQSVLMRSGLPGFADALKTHLEAMGSGITARVNISLEVTA